MQKLCHFCLSLLMLFTFPSQISVVAELWWTMKTSVTRCRGREEEPQWRVWMHFGQSRRWTVVGSGVQGGWAGAEVSTQQRAGCREECRVRHSLNRQWSDNVGESASFLQVEGAVTVLSNPSHFERASFPDGAAEWSWESQVHQAGLGWPVLGRE